MLETVVLSALFMICVLPMTNWYLRGMAWIPLGECLVLMHLIYYVLPCLSGREDWAGFSESEHLMAELAVGLFLISFLIVYYAILRTRWEFLSRATILRREMRPDAMWGFFALWIVGSVLVQNHLLPAMASYTNVFNSFLTALGAMSIAYLFYQMGRGNLTRSGRFFAIGGFGLGLASGFASGLLQGNVQTLGAAFLAYTLGAKKIPFSGIALSFVFLMILQLGKHEYRTAYWVNQSGAADRDSLVEHYETWINAGLEKLLPSDEAREDNTQNVFARASLIHILATAMAQTDESRPCLYGTTYAMVPELLVPRAFWPDKPRGTEASESIGIYYGVQSEAGAEVTGIAVGPLTEGWANFGWVGMAVAGSLFAILYGIGVRTAFNLVPSQVGWLLCAVLIGYCIEMELCFAEMFSSLVQAMVVAFALLFIFSQKPPKSSGPSQATVPRSAPLSAEGKPPR